MAIVYILTNILNDKKYIGKTTRSFDVRLTQHLFDTKIHRYTSAFHSAIRKYGIDNFHIECIKVSDKLVDLWEKHLIKRWGTKSPGGYNLTDGGDGSSGRIISEQHRENIRKSSTGRKLSKESRASISEKNTGRLLGRKHPSSILMTLILPDGTEETFGSLRGMCRKYNLDSGTMSKIANDKYVSNKSYKGYKCYYTDKEI